MWQCGIQSRKFVCGKVQVGKDQKKAQSERDSHSKNRGGKNQTNNQGPVTQSHLKLRSS